MKNHLLYLLFSLALLSSCNTSKEIIYFQDVEVNSPEAVAPPQDITVQPKDQISIVVSSKDPELAALFNLTRVQQRVGSTGLNNSNNNGEISGYTLDDKGTIDFPVLGNLTVAGMTRSQIAALVKQRLKEENLVNDPVVTVEFMNLSFSVLGEVKTPGKYSISKDYITLLEAISMAGDLTIYGKRDAIFVIREEKGERVTHWVDLRSCDLFKSPDISSSEMANASFEENLMVKLNGTSILSQNVMVTGDTLYKSTFFNPLRMVKVSFNPSRLTTSVISVGDFNVSNSLLMLVLDLKIPKSEKSFIALVEELLFELSLTRMAAVRV